jgi:hypothetical protein
MDSNYGFWFHYKPCQCQALKEQENCKKTGKNKRTQEKKTHIENGSYKFMQFITRG